MTAVRINLLLSAVLMLHISGECFNIECDPNGCRIMDHTIFWVGGEDYEVADCTKACAIMIMMPKTAGSTSEDTYFVRVENAISSDTIGDTGCINGTCNQADYARPCIPYITNEITKQAVSVREVE